MGYHIESSRSGFKELPDRILVREDGWLGAYKFDGEPIVDYWYVPEQRVDELRQELAIREASEQEKVIEYLRQENVDWEDKYRALAKENEKLRWLCGELSEFLTEAEWMIWPEYREAMVELGIKARDA